MGGKYGTMKVYNWHPKLISEFGSGVIKETLLKNNKKNSNGYYLLSINAHSNAHSAIIGIL